MAELAVLESTRQKNNHCHRLWGKFAKDLAQISFTVHTISSKIRIATKRFKETKPKDLVAMIELPPNILRFQLVRELLDDNRRTVQIA
ncbi:hypothetical protein KIN20_003321 [Parelaphostrongylus tenuis]|uniref:Uncharacterized protein n=1 Tax=Parelaphostrongylus tenuis TaxID=148309 RepID=A0AAD5MI72_PARTN|nr:hypothetical protein KIN20_003321 [Parelaphostrongylus tenuis]